MNLVFFVQDQPVTPLPQGEPTDGPHLLSPTGGVTDDSSPTTNHPEALTCPAGCNEGKAFRSAAALAAHRKAKQH